ncbi:unannotated protein [freshwater metagenome]|uniref:Unannotated protein n=1 Tax=freshwater metagenome TaxID=449393 RepID=A0A6J6B6T5_9ZZZZ
MHHAQPLVDPQSDPGSEFVQISHEPWHHCRYFLLRWGQSLAENLELSQSPHGFQPPQESQHPRSPRPAQESQSPQGFQPPRTPRPAQPPRAARQPQGSQPNSALARNPTVLPQRKHQTSTRRAHHQYRPRSDSLQLPLRPVRLPRNLQDPQLCWPRQQLLHAAVQQSGHGHPAMPRSVGELLSFAPRDLQTCAL